MERLLQEFEKPITDQSGTVYRVHLFGRSRPADTWQGWLVFERLSDGQRFATGVETTQPNAEAVVYWASGLTNAYFDGALDRALRPAGAETFPLEAPKRIVDELSDAETRQRRLVALERAVIAAFTRHQVTRLLTRTVMDELSHAHADVVRALEDLEKQGGLLIRRTEEGNDFLFLTRRGVEVAGVADLAGSDVVLDREPPKMR